MKKQIPNIITLCNLTCGVIATACAAFSSLSNAAFFIFLGILFDFFDGLTARALHVSSPLGKELDSLADVVTSGAAPAVILFRILSDPGYGPDWSMILALTAFLVPGFSAYRLAKFNLDTRQTHSFLGLPVPCNALIWATLGIYANREIASYIFPFFWKVTQPSLLPTDWVAPAITSIYGLIAMAVLSILTDLAMISEIPMFALKFKNLSWQDNKLRFLFLIACAILIVLFGIFGITLSIFLYIILSLLTQKKAPANE